MRKNVLWALMLAVGLVSCNNENEAPEVDVPTGEAAFLSVSLKAAGTIGASRANTGSFEYGSPTENEVKSVDFHFFKANGDKYSVVSTGSNVITWKANKEPAESVEKVSDVVLVIKKHETELPAKVVAVVNAATTGNYDNLNALATTLVQNSPKTDKGFVMSNSVYADGNEVINATDILPENIFAAEDADLTVEPGQVIPADKVTSLSVNPIDIYVERVAAKVRVQGAEGVALAKMPVYDAEGKTQMKDAAGNAVYAKILGWDVTNTVTGANTLKTINPAWNNLGFAPWNNAELFRSYWAETPASLVPAHTHKFNTLTDSDPKYYFENTKEWAEENSVDQGSGNQAPQLLVAAQLINENNEAIQLAKWYNVLYTIDGLQTAMVNQIASKLFVKESTTTGEGEEAVTTTTYRSITPADVTFEQRAATTADNRYEVIMVAKSGTTYYSAANAKENGTAMTEQEVASIIGSVDPAQMWTEGKTYYYTDIKHFGEAIGMVRNHVYDIKLTKIMGFGTPVYNPDHVIIPERPDEQEAANLAAQINILSWHVVSNEVTLQ